MARRQVGGVWWESLKISPSWLRKHGYVNVHCDRCFEDIAPEEPDAVYVEAEVRVEDGERPGEIERVLQGYFFCGEEHAREYGFVGTWEEHARAMREPPDDSLVRSKATLDRARSAGDAARAASEARKRVQGEMLNDDFMMGFLSGDPKTYPEYGREAFEERRRGREAALSEALAKEAEAAEEFARATEELRDVTVEPRVEGLKLRFETRRLQATLSAGVLVGAATVTEVLLPPDPGYAFLMYLAYAAFISSLSGCLADMNRISIYVENLLVGGRTEVEEPGWREKVSRAMMYLNQRSLSLGLAFFVLFAMLNLT